MTVDQALQHLDNICRHYSENPKDPGAREAFLREMGPRARGLIAQIRRLQSANEQFRAEHATLDETPGGS